MAFGETADLVAALKLKDEFTGPLNKAKTSLSGFDSKLTDTQGRAYKAGQQIGTGILNAAKIATAAIGGLTGLLLLSAKEGQDAQNVQIKYATAIANSDKVTSAYVDALNAQQDALLSLGGVDDERIKAAQTQLIQMGLTGDQVLKLTALSLDLSKATGKDLTASTLAVGKAFQGNNRALLQLGIVVPKGADAIAILNKRFKGTTQALSGQLDTRLDVLKERLANVREQAGIKLLPVLTRIVDVVGSKLVPAFGKFIDAILPSAIGGLQKLADFLDSGKATEAFSSFLGIAKTAAPIIKEAASDTLTIVQTAVGLFQSLPPEIQALAVAGLTINKLTGGLVTNIAGGLISAVLSGFKGVLGVTAGIVNVNGGVGAGSLLGLADLLPFVPILAAVATTVVASMGAREKVDTAIATGNVSDLQRIAEDARKHGVSDENNAALKALQAIVHNTAAVAGPGAIDTTGPDASEKAQQQRNTDFTSNPTRKELRVQIGQLKAAQKKAVGDNAKDIARALATVKGRLDKRIADAAAQASRDAAIARRDIVAAIKDASAAPPPIVNVTVPVTNSFNSRVVESNLQRYHTFVPGLNTGPLP